MSDVSSDTLATSSGTVPIEPAVPVVAQRDHVLPILVGLSLLVHATVFLPSLLRQSEAEAAPPKEIPVEVVQLPPAPKPQAPKQEARRQEPPKPPAPKPPVQKAEQQKPEPKKVAEKLKPPAKPAQKSVADRMKELLGPMPAIAMPASAADGTDAASYTQLVLSKVAKAKKQGRYQGTPGAASVSFTLGDSGEVASVEIVRPSGDPSLDAEAIAMVKRGAPYPPPPPGGRRDYTITLRFQTVT